LWGAALLGMAAVVAKKTYNYIKSIQQEPVKVAEEIPVNTPDQKSSFFEKCKKKIKALAVAPKVGWAKAIFLNTL